MPTQMDEYASLPQHDAHKGTISHSKHMPRWIWFIVAKSLGVKTHSKDKPILGYILYFLTLLFGASYVITTCVYTYFDVKSKDTKFDALNAFILVIMSFGFFFIGLYSNKLGHKLFSNPMFLQSLRLHSKTIMRISAPILTGIAGIGFLFLYVYEKFATGQNSSKPCKDLKIWPYICHIRYVSQMGFACFAYLWNLLVSIVCFSLCRTHTISIRHFLLELDEDAMVYILQRNKVPHIQHPIPGERGEGEALCQDSTDRSPLLPGINCNSGDRRERAHSDTNLYNSAVERGAEPYQHEPIASENDDDDKTKSKQSPCRRSSAIAWDQEIFQKRVRSVSELYQAALRRPSTTSSNLPEHLRVPFTGQPAQSDVQSPDWLNASHATIAYSSAPSSKMLEVDEILDRFWRLQCRLMTTSLALQRWLASWIILILFWSMVYLVYWISHEASIIDMFLFFVPLIMLPLLCSGPTEVNGEGQRVSKSICPTQERLEIINYINNSPLAVTIYGFALNHSSVVTAIVAVALAFATKIIVTNV